MFASRTPVAMYEDGLHSIAREDGALVPTIDFDFAGLDPQQPEPMIPVSQAASAVARILDWATELDNLRCNGARIAALSTLLNPTGRYRSLAAIARDANISRAIVSRWLLDLKDRYGIKVSLRGSLIRENCRQAQLASVKKGTHASRYTRKNSIPIHKSYAKKRNTGQVNPPGNIELRST
jgi:hypothetical protein